MIKQFFDKVRPHFEEGGKLKAFHSVFEGMETFMLVPNTTSRVGVSIHDAIDSKRIMSFVVIALLPALLFGMYNVGYQKPWLPANWLRPASGRCLSTASCWFFLKSSCLTWLVSVSSLQWHNEKEEIQEGYLVTGILIPLIVPVDCPLWMLHFQLHSP